MEGRSYKQIAKLKRGFVCVCVCVCACACMRARVLALCSKTLFQQEEKIKTKRKNT
jgi:hypothetical protein